MKTSQHHQRRGPLSGSQGLRQVSYGLGRRLGGLTLLAVASGCPSPDAAGKYDRFNEETEDDRDRPEPKLDIPPIDFGEGGQVFPDISGVFLVAIETSIAPGLPLQFVADVTSTVDSSTGDGTLTIEFQPLALEVGSTTDPRDEVGPPIEVEADVVAGAYALVFGETTVTGEANPITGSDILADLVLEGTLRIDDAWCGIATGDVISPIQAPLDGSTFAAVRLADRSERTDPVAVKCDDIDFGGPDGETDGETGVATGSTGS